MGTPAVQYVYEDGASSGEAKYVRLDSVIYPDGRTVYYNYPEKGANPSVGAMLSRLDNIAEDADGTVQYAQYAYLGAATIVRVARPSVTNGLTLSYGTSANHHSSLDRFGRVEEQAWTSGQTTLDSYTYTYDRNSNRTARANNLNSSLSEQYAYDGLDRLADTNRYNSTSQTFQDFQNWTLDSLGNWSGFTDQGTSQTRTHDAANQTTAITANPDWIDPAYDTAGNMTSGPMAGDEGTRLHYVDDAWNHMTAAYADDGGQQSAGRLACVRAAAHGERRAPAPGVARAAGAHAIRREAINDRLPRTSPEFPTTRKLFTSPFHSPRRLSGARTASRSDSQ